MRAIRAKFTIFAILIRQNVDHNGSQSPHSGASRMASRKHWIKNPGAEARLKSIIRRVTPEMEEEITKAIRKSGVEAVGIIKGDVPVDDGELRDSVGWSYGDPPPGVLGASDTAAENSRIPAHLRGSVYAGGKKAPHAHLVHYGTKLRTRKDGRTTGVMPPLPFFFPNIRSLRRRWRARITRAATKGIKRGLKN